MELEFGLTAEAFSIDEQRRTMTGRVVPWGKVSTVKGGRRYRFARGSIRCVDPKFVKFNEDHSRALRLGRATGIEDKDDGLHMTFRVAEGERGDRALARALAGDKTGLSVEVEFDESDTERDPENEGAWLVNLSNCEGVAFVRNPSFDDSRLISVTASADEGEAMDPVEQTPAAQPGQSDTTTVTMSRDDLRAVLAEMQPASTRPVVIEPRTSVASVTEPKSYRFDRSGNIQKGSHEFSTDVFAAGHGDGAANERVMEFVRAQFDVITTNVDELNVPPNRPNMYVDQRDFRYPIWNAINKGTLANITPFTFPKFSSASGLVAAHSEGVEPSSGALVTTSQTVTPSALSGKAKISREVWDQGGNPQISGLIWRQMLKGWYEALEAAAVAVLDAASPTQIDFSGTPGLSDDDLDQAITAAFASLQFVRGGFSMDNMFTQIDLYKALVAAVDSNGRRLYPALGPANATGTVRSRFAALDLNGIAALPAWALAATGSVAASSYLFDSETVHGWASAPQRLDFNIEVANVYIGLWGYKATAISDVTGVREIVYDPS